MKTHSSVLSLKPPICTKGYALIVAGITLLCGIIYTPALFGQTQITINTGSIIATGVSTKYGIDLNAGIDLDANRPAGARPLYQALQEMGVKHLRFPGGKKSLYYVWSGDPTQTDTSKRFWVKGSSYAAKAGPNGTLTFDKFMALCKRIGATPHINVAYNPAAKLGSKYAGAWVKYANVDKQYGVKYWEIGNEMWQSELGFTAQALTDTVKAYIAAMKAADPTIKVGVSWKGDIQSLINNTGLDFFAVSNYLYPQHPATSYQGYKDNNVNFCFTNNSLTLQTVVSEHNLMTWSGLPYDGLNNAGKGLMNFDMVGQFLKSSKTDYACFWTTRWYGGYTPTWRIMHAVDNYNNLTPVALPMKLYAMFLKDKLVSVTNSNQSLPTYASYDQASGTLSVFIINKSQLNPQNVTLKVTSADTYTNLAQVWQYRGTTDMDTIPTLTNLGTTAVANKTITDYSLPPVSITAFVFTATRSCAGTQSTIEKSICEGSTYSFNGQSLVTAGTYTSIMQKANGCDSLVTLNLTVLSKQTTDTTVTIAYGDSLVFGNQVLKTSCSSTKTFPSKHGCDSTVNLTLIVANILKVESGEPGNISVYPVPSNNRLIIETGHENIRLITIVDQHGIEVLKTAVNKNGHIELDIERLASGMYVLITQTPTQRRTFRIVKR